MDFKKIKKKIIDKYNRKTVNYSHYLGEVLKRKRTELSMTQEAVSHGICSVSYLSKIENNKMSPNSLFVREISDRMGIDLEAYAQTFEDTNVLKDALQAFYYQDVLKLEQLYENVRALNHDIMTDLFRLLLSNLRGAYVESENLMKTILPGMNNMDLFTSVTTVIVAAIHSYETRQYRQAYNLLWTLDQCESIDPMLRGLESMYAYYVRQKIGKKNNSAKHYEVARRIFAEYNYPKKLTSLHLHRLYFLAEEDPEEVKRQFSILPPSCLDAEHRNLYQVIRLTVCPEDAVIDPENVLFDLQANPKDEWFYRALSILMIFNRKNPAFLKKAAPHLEDVSEPFLVEKSLHHSLTIADEKGYKNLLRDICFPMALAKQESFYIQYFTNELIEILIREARYKEAHSVMQRQKDALEEMATIQT